jgi:AcrR family transcriptional regulator
MSLDARYTLGKSARYAHVEMASRSYTSPRGRGTPASVERVLDAAARLIKEDAFHTATMEELAAAAGVSRATVFNRFGSKLGVLEALFTRGMQGPEMQAIAGALAIEDPVEALEAVIDASCAIWEASADVHLQLQAIATLEPDAAELVERQLEQQREEIHELIRRLAKAGRLRKGLSHARAAATLHMLSSLESFLWLRRSYGLSMRQTRETLTELAGTLLRE